MQLLADGMEIHADLGDHILALAAIAGDQLHIVDKNHLVAVGQDVRAQVGRVHAGALDQVEAVQRRALAHVHDAVKVQRGQSLFLDELEIYVGVIGHHAVAGVLLVGLVAVKSNFLAALGHAETELQRKRRLADRGIGAEDDKIAAADVHPFVEHRNAEVQPVQRLLGVLPVDEAVDQLGIAIALDLRPDGVHQQHGRLGKQLPGMS